MARVLIYFAHPGQRFSQVNASMAEHARRVEGITFVDLYREYPRFNIDVGKEQTRLTEHDIILFQFPLFWYSTPSIIKEWQDLVLEHGFAYGRDGTQLAGKSVMAAITAAGPEDAYTPQGYQHYDLRTFLRPLEQTARLCKMTFLPPYALFSSLRAPAEGSATHHIAGYVRLIEALRDDRYEPGDEDLVNADTLPIVQGA
ncbi:MAG: NAD(P)H-dependent oxidoreductase [Pseudomonadota bacterium]